MSQIFQALFLAASAGRALASCAHGTHLSPRAEDGSVPIATFGYTGLSGPFNWVSLDPANIACSTGVQQSPIDMVSGVFNMIPASELELNIPDFTEGTEFENLGSTVEVIAPPGASLAFGTKQFELQQFHFHLPSEHLDNGTSHAMEMHMVWQSAAQEIAVIGVYIDVAADGAAAAPAVTAPVDNSTVARKFKRGEFKRRQAIDTDNDTDGDLTDGNLTDGNLTDGNATDGNLTDGTDNDRNTRRQSAKKRVKRAGSMLKNKLDRRQAAVANGPTTLLETIFSQVGEIATPGTKVKTGPLVLSEVVDILKAGSFQGYMGSLTTPPCSEGVNWLVSTARLHVTASTFLSVRDVIGFNSRFVQNTPNSANILQVAAIGAVSAANALATAA